MLRAKQSLPLSQQLWRRAVNKISRFTDQIMLIRSVHTCPTHRPSVQFLPQMELDHSSIEQTLPQVSVPVFVAIVAGETASCFRDYFLCIFLYSVQVYPCLQDELPTPPCFLVSFHRPMPCMDQGKCTSSFPSDTEHLWKEPYGS